MPQQAKASEKLPLEQSCFREPRPSALRREGRAAEIFTHLRQHFTEAQIVEMTLRTALCGAFNRFNEFLQFNIEQGGVAVVDAAE